eukprot:366466-Chlamydomonas_euryale.AAC.14
MTLGSNGFGFEWLWVQTALGLNDLRFKRLWVLVALCSNGFGFKRLWVQTSLGLNGFRGMMDHSASYWVVMAGGGIGLASDITTARCCSRSGSCPCSHLHTIKSWRGMQPLVDCDILNPTFNLMLDINITAQSPAQPHTNQPYPRLPQIPCSCEPHPIAPYTPSCAPAAQSPPPSKNGVAAFHSHSHL